MRALYWWIDRWRKSTAYTDLTLEEQAAYRNLLDEGTLRNGPIPNDERVLAKASGDAIRWPAIRENVLKRFTVQADGLHNETLDLVIRQSLRRAANQQHYRAGRANGTAHGRTNGHANGGANGGDNAHGNGADNGAANGAHNEADSPDPDPDPDL
jgi:uncharacterized protein YdaU (DUF1376 family)